MQRTIQENPCKFLQNLNSEHKSTEKISTCHLAPDSTYLSIQFSPRSLKGDTEDITNYSSG